MKWNKNKIVSDLKKLIGNKGIIEEEQNPEGGYYCRDIYLSTKDEDDAISIVGFNLDDISDIDDPAEDIEYVEIRNLDSDSDGGLDKHASKKIRLLYFIALDYFSNKNIEVVDNLKDYF